MLIQIKHRHTLSVMWEGEARDMRDAVREALAAAQEADCQTEQP